MKQYRPSYYKDFRCIAGACRDNCCIGWEIDIDDNTAAFYRGVEGAFGCRLKENILPDEEGSHFILKGDRCPFLNKDNLCDIYCELGEGALCEICDQHPRYHEWFGDWKESGIGLCCEAACRLIFSQEEHRFELVDIEEEAGEPVDEDGFSALFYARERAFHLVEQGRFDLLLDFAKALQPALDEEDWEHVRKTADTYQTLAPAKEPVFVEKALQSLLDFLQGLEPIDPLWPQRLQSIAECLPSLLIQQKKLQIVYPAYCKNMQQLANTFLFRYFCKSLFDGDCLSPVMVSIIACLIVTLLDLDVLQKKGSFDLEDQVLCAKAFSKEIEYCTENLEALRDYCWDMFGEDDHPLQNLLYLLY